MSSISMETQMSSPVKMSSVDKVKKNRTFYINELFEALDKVDDFPYTPAQMHEWLVKATKVEGSKFRNLTKSAEESATQEKKPKRLSGWHMFVQSTGNKSMVEKSAEWKELGTEGQAIWNSKATEHNTSVGIEPSKPKKKSYTLLMEEWNKDRRDALEKWTIDLAKWAVTKEGPPPPEPVCAPLPEKPIQKPRKKKDSDSEDSSPPNTPNV